MTIKQLWGNFSTNFYPRLYNFSKAFLKLEEGIDDILQEVFLKIWQNRKNIKKTETFNSYIFTITRNLLMNELRSVAEEFLLSEQIEYQELQEKVDQMIASLPERQREVFLLSRKEGLSHKEIAEKLAIAEKTVKYHISQSIGVLKNLLIPDDCNSGIRPGRGTSQGIVLRLIWPNLQI
jgi:RNA polymerase sigma-70 factor, ECF subfamily